MNVSPMNQLLSFLNSYLRSTHISNEQRELATLIKSKIESHYLNLEEDYFRISKNLGALEQRKIETEKKSTKEIDYDHPDGFIGEDYLDLPLDEL